MSSSLWHWALGGFLVGSLVGSRFRGTSSGVPGRPSHRGIALVGDSFAVGLGPQILQLAREDGVPFAWDGEVGTGVLSWVDSPRLVALLERKPRGLLVSLGGNDYQRNDGEAVIQAIDQFSHIVKQAGVKLLWVEPLSFNIEDKNGVKERWLQHTDFVNWYPSSQLDVPRSSDGIHPTGAGYQQWAAELWPWALDHAG